MELKLGADFNEIGVILCCICRNVPVSSMSLCSIKPRHNGNKSTNVNVLSNKVAERQNNAFNTSVRPTSKCVPT